MSYLLDTNVFIQAKNLHYGLDFCPAFWQWLIDGQANGLVFSIDRVADEISAVADELTEWMDAYGKGLFRPLAPETSQHFSALNSWAISQHYKETAISTFYQIADYYLVAEAMAGNHVLVTHEVPSNSAKQIKIPNACMGLGVRFMTPFEMLSKEKARFVLGARS